MGAAMSGYEAIHVEHEGRVRIIRFNLSYQKIPSAAI
jgi:hypothetical protein